MKSLKSARFRLSWKRSSRDESDKQSNISGPSQPAASSASSSSSSSYSHSNGIIKPANKAGVSVNVSTWNQLEAPSIISKAVMASKPAAIPAPAATAPQPLPTPQQSPVTTVMSKAMAKPDPDLLTPTPLPQQPATETYDESNLFSPPTPFSTPPQPFQMGSQQSAAEATPPSSSEGPGAAAAKKGFGMASGSQLQPAAPFWMGSEADNDTAMLDTNAMMASDEAYARLLQEQPDAAAASSSGFPMTPDIEMSDEDFVQSYYAQLNFDQLAHDEEMARNLQELEDQESFHTDTGDKMEIEPQIEPSVSSPAEESVSVMSSKAKEKEPMRDVPMEMAAPPVAALTSDEAVIHNLGKMIMSRKCAAPKCGRKLLADGNAVTVLSSRLSKDMGAGLVSSWLKCDRCKADTCVGCGSPMIGSLQTKALVVPGTGKVLKSAICCDTGRLVLLWVVLCGSKYTKPKPKPASGVTTRAKAAEQSAASASLVIPPYVPKTTLLPSKTGASVGSAAPATTTAAAAAPPPPPPVAPVNISNSRGTGYGGPEHGHHAPKKSKSKATAPVEAAGPSKSAIQDDNIDESAFRLAALLLPVQGRSTTFEKQTEMLISITARSPLLDKAADLLRNDCIEDIALRHKVYDGLMGFLQALGSHPVTVEVLHKERVVYPAGQSLIYVSMGDVSPDARANGKGPALETVTPLLKLLAKLGIQCNTLLHHAKTNKDEFQTADDRAALALCSRVCELVARFKADMDAVRATGGSSSSGNGGSSNPSKVVPVTLVESAERKMEKFREWQRENAVMEEADEKLLQDFRFASEARSAASGVPRKGRIKRLMTELTTLRTSLPEGIYVRHGASRLDIMKVLIVGPKGTPYEGGLFEFDLFCPLTYPDNAPMMIFKTTGSGSVRFNPNLYEDGKVCLSLLGTWSGQPWMPGQSTLLQVLVSIQSMVFCDEPWYNEPGRETRPNAIASKAHNQELQGHTIRQAHLGWIQSNPASAAPSPADNSVWRNVVQKHFEVNGRDIMRTVQTWASGATSGSGSANTLNTASNELASALKQGGYLY